MQQSVTGFVVIDFVAAGMLLSARFSSFAFSRSRYKISIAWLPLSFIDGLRCGIADEFAKKGPRVSRCFV